MHPKHPPDLVISDDEVREALRAWMWTENNFLAVLHRAADEMEADVDRRGLMKK
jgi:hypothetical protein